MVTYVAMLNFTDKGIAGIKDTTRRAAAARELGRTLGVNLRDIYWTLGECDLVCVVEGDSEQAIAAFELKLALQGNVRSRSMRAFTAGEMDEVLAKV